MTRPAAQQDPHDAGPTVLHRDELKRVLILTSEIARAATQAIVTAGHADLTGNVEIRTLLRLADRGALRPRDLIEATGLTSGGTSNLLDRLERRGLVKRRYGGVDGDRRGASVAITRTGVSVIRSIGQAVSNSLRDAEPTLAELRRLCSVVSSSKTATVPRGPRTDLERVELLAALGETLVSVLAGVDSGSDPTPAKTAVTLSLADDAAGTRPTVIGRHTGFTSGGVSLLVDRLEARGLVDRRQGDGADRRVVMVSITPLGRAHLDDLLGRLSLVVDDMALAVANVVESLRAA